MRRILHVLVVGTRETEVNDTDPGVLPAGHGGCLEYISVSANDKPSF